MKTDNKNTTDLWFSPQSGDAIKYLRASYTSHTFAPHVHDELVIGITQGGIGHFRTRNKQYIAMADSVIVFNPNEPHSGGVYDNHRWLYRAIYIARSRLDELATQLGVKAGQVYFENSLFVDRELAGAFISAQESSRNPSASTLESEHCLLIAVENLLIRYSNRSAIAPRGLTESFVLRRIKDYMHANFFRDISLRELADTARLTEFQVIRDFKRSTGLTPHAYLNHVRLQNAKNLILRGTPFTVVASETGFFDQSHLIRVFKHAYGYTPGQYARAAKSQMF